MQTLPVVFRTLAGSGRPIILFPSVPGDRSGRHCYSFTEDGFGNADYCEVMDASSPARWAESAPLANSLGKLGYRLRQVMTASVHHHRARYHEAKHIAQALESRASSR